MKGNSLVKVSRLIGHFASHPRDLYRYIAQTRSSPLEIGKPWISWPAIDFLESYVRPGMTVFEYGSGGSTRFFASRGAVVTSVEHDIDWHQRVRSKAPSANLILQPVDFLQDNHDQASAYVEKLTENYDIILIDGLDIVPAQHARSLRLICFARAIDHLKPGGVIILDDAWRYDGIVFASGKPTKILEFQGPGPGWSGVTRTDAYFYS